MLVTMEVETNEDNNIKNQSLTITAGSLAAAAINAIIGYVAVYFFKPLWDRIVKLFKYEK
jgi:hypothetical protein